MKIKSTLIIMLFAGVFFSSCATIGYDNAVIYSNPPGVIAEKVVITRGKETFEQQNVSFPFELPRPFNVWKEKAVVQAYYSADSEPVRLEIHKKFRGKFICSCIFFFPELFWIDLVTGCIYIPDKEEYVINFMPSSQQRQNSYEQQSIPQQQGSYQDDQYKKQYEEYVRQQELQKKKQQEIDKLQEEINKRQQELDRQKQGLNGQ